MEKVINDDPEWKKGILQAKGGGKILYWDDYMGRLFYCDKATIQEAVSTVNLRCSGRCEWSSLNEIYRELELPGGKAGEILGAGGMYCKIKNYELDLNHAVQLFDGKVSAIVFTFYFDPMPEDRCY